MTDTATRSQLATTGLLATWAFVIGLVVTFIGVATMSTDAVMIGATVGGVGLVVALVCGAFRLFGKR